MLECNATPDQCFTDVFRSWVESFEGHLDFWDSQLSSNFTMNSFPRVLTNIGRKDAAWTCSSCAKAISRQPRTAFFKPSMRNISSTSKSQQNALPSVEQMREPQKIRNASTLYYAISIIMGTVALSYGSVPLYKMVCRPSSCLHMSKLIVFV